MLENYSPMFFPGTIFDWSLRERTQVFTGFATMSGNFLTCSRDGGCTPGGSTSIGEVVHLTQTAETYTVGSALFNDASYLLYGCDGPPPNPDRYQNGGATCEGGYATWRIHAGYGAGFRITDQTSVSLTFG